MVSTGSCIAVRDCPNLRAHYAARNRLHQDRLRHQTEPPDSPGRLSRCRYSPSGWTRTCKSPLAVASGTVGRLGLLYDMIASCHPWRSPPQKILLAVLRN